MQKTETGILPQQEEKKPELTQLANVAVDKDNKIYINWPVDKKELVLVALGEAVKLVATYQANTIVKPKPNIMDFVRGIKT